MRIGNRVLNLELMTDCGFLSSGETPMLLVFFPTDGPDEVTATFSGDDAVRLWGYIQSMAIDELEAPCPSS